MKKILFVTFLILVFFIFPSEVFGVNSNCTRKSNGGYYCRYSKNTNDEDFRYSITDVTKVNNSTIRIYGWGLLFNADSYDGFSNSYAIQVISNGKVVKTIPATTVKIKKFTCAHFQKSGKFAKYDNADCEYQASWSDTSFRQFIHGKNTSDGWNNLYRNIGFYADINIDEIKSIIAEANNIECDRPTNPSCVHDNCGGVADEKNNTNNTLCTYERNTKLQFHLRIRLTAPSAAVKNSSKVFYKDIAIYRDVVSSSVESFFESKGMSIDETNYSTNVIARADSALVRTGVGLSSSTLKCGTACRNAVDRYNNFTTSNRNVYLPTYHYHGENERTFPRNVNTRRALYSASGGHIVLNRMYLSGTISAGVAAIEDGKKLWRYVLFRSGLSNRKGYRGGGYVTESWTYPTHTKTMINLDVSKTCTCKRTPIDFDEGDKLPTQCKEKKQSASKNDSLVIDESTTVSTNTALDILLRGDNSSYATEDSHTGMSFVTKDLASVRNTTNFNTSEIPVYCLKNRNFVLYGKEDIRRAFTLGEEDKYLYAGRYFRIANNSMTSSINTYCTSSNKSQLNSTMDRTNLTYDVTYEPKDSLETKMDSSKKAGAISVSNVSGGYRGSTKTNYEMKNTQNYYFDYQKNKVQVGENIGENIKDGYYIDDHNIYPILSSAKVDTDYDIDTTIEGNKKSELGEDYTYTCQYSVVGGETPPNENDPDPDNPDDTDIPFNELNNYYYRTISLSDIFPDHRGSKRPYNWRYIINEESIERNSNKTYSELPEYVVVLSPSNMRDIRNYNIREEKEGGYLNYSLDCEIIGGERVCESDFLNNINKYSQSFVRNNTK